MLAEKDLVATKLSNEEFAHWIEQQTDCWWFVDGDRELVHRVMLPCPSDELAVAVRKVGRAVNIFDVSGRQNDCGFEVSIQELDDFADRDNNQQERNFLCSWADSEEKWVLIDDTDAATLFGQAETSEGH